MKRKQGYLKASQFKSIPNSLLLSWLIALDLDHRPYLWGLLPQEEGVPSSSSVALFYAISCSVRALRSRRAAVSHSGYVTLGLAGMNRPLLPRKATANDCRTVQCSLALWGERGRDTYLLGGDGGAKRFPTSSGLAQPWPFGRGWPARCPPPCSPVAQGPGRARASPHLLVCLFYSGCTQRAGGPRRWQREQAAHPYLLPSSSGTIHSCSGRLRAQLSVAPLCSACKSSHHRRLAMRKAGKQASKGEQGLCSGGGTPPHTHCAAAPARGMRSWTATSGQAAAWQEWEEGGLRRREKKIPPGGRREREQKNEGKGKQKAATVMCTACTGRPQH